MNPRRAPGTRATGVAAGALLLPAALVAVPGPAGVPTAAADHPDAACTDAPNSTIRIHQLPGLRGRFTPNCLLAEDRERINWSNDDLGNHDPGDGVSDVREFPGCFHAAGDSASEGDLPPGHTYSIELRFDAATETLHLEKAWYAGERQDLDHDDPGLGTIECPDCTWSFLDDTIVVPYIDHVYPDHSSGELRLDV